MRHRVLFPALIPLLACGCALLPTQENARPEAQTEPSIEAEAAQAALPEEAGGTPPDESNLAPRDPVSAGPRRTVAALGDPSRAGLWLETPLVKGERPGRITAPNGKSTPVTLIPIEGPETAGSRLSLAAMRSLGISPADLVELDVIAES